jgi:hypothetical protein
MQRRLLGSAGKTRDVLVLHHLGCCIERRGGFTLSSVVNSPESLILAKLTDKEQIKLNPKGNVDAILAAAPLRRGSL